MDPVLHDKIEAFLIKFKEYLDGKNYPFTISIRDPSGNSFISNPNAPKEDPLLKNTQFERTQ